jgi:hypothetical protein
MMNHETDFRTALKELNGTGDAGWLLTKGFAIRASVGQEIELPGLQVYTTINVLT